MEFLVCPSLLELIKGLIKDLDGIDEVIRSCSSFVITFSAEIKSSFSE